LDRDQRQDDGAGKRRQIAKLAGAEGEMGIARMPTRECIGDRGNPERRGVGRHVPAIGQQRHRSEKRARDDLADHHCRSQRHHEPGTALVPIVLRTEKYVIVRPLVD
jgi:hypothetical protein